MPEEILTADPPPPAPEHHEAHEEAAAAAPPAPEAAAPEAAAPEAAAEEPSRKHWYVVKVQSGREDTIKEAIEKRIRLNNLQDCFGQIVIPVERISETKPDKNGRKVTRTKERKLYPGYLFVEVEYNDRILYTFRETSGVGDFVGATPGQPTRAPTPMAEKEVQRILGIKTDADEPSGKTAPPKPKWTDVGQRVKVMDGPFVNMEGVIKEVREDLGQLQVELNIFGRPANVDFEYYQVEQA